MMRLLTIPNTRKDTIMRMNTNTVIRRRMQINPKNLLRTRTTY
ncbi:hypothetical protein [Adhaeribacter aerolatus]|nr:hypothetical protein [Adhaeribacter aerolatus]